MRWHKVEVKLAYPVLLTAAKDVSYRWDATGLYGIFAGVRQSSWHEWRCKDNG